MVVPLVTDGVVELGGVLDLVETDLDESEEELATWSLGGKTTAG